MPELNCDKCGIKTTDETIIQQVFINEELKTWCNNCIDNYLYECANCENTNDYSDSVQVANNFNYGTTDWCQPCANSRCEDCDSCHTTYEDDLTPVLINGNTRTQKWCNDCIESDAHFCAKCENFSTDNTSPVLVKSGEDYWCEACITASGFRCESCHKNYDEENPNLSTTYIQDKDTNICNSCYDDGEYFYCNSCDKTYSMDNYEGEDMCHACYINNIPGLEPPEANIFDDQYELVYNDEILIGTNKPYMGIELEVDVHGDLREIVKKTNDIIRYKGKWGLIKKDNSVKEGMEMISVPMLLEDQKAKWNELFQNDIVKSMHNSEGNAGMHIHLHRESLSHIGLARLLFLIYGQKENKKFTEFIAERSPNQFWKTNPRNIKEIYKDRQKQEDSPRYEAVNLKNHDTVEFRMFNSDINKQSIFKALEFVDAVQNFCNNEIFTRPLWQNFAEWVKKTDKYPTLKLYVEVYEEQNAYKEPVHTSYYINNLFKISSQSIIYYEKDSKGNTVFCTEDGMNWWTSNEQGIIAPMCGQVPQGNNFHFLPIERLTI